jgi:uncharacterized membrane-anchored protein YhcB (DUF1043 family)
LESPFSWSSFWSDPAALIGAAIVLLAALALGFWLGRRRDRDAAERARELEDRLQLAEDEMSRYRQEVADHFGQTSQLLRDLTMQYRNVYEHLAEGARTLCPEAGTLLPGSLAEAALPAEASEPPRTNGAGRPDDDAQLDLLEDTERWQPRPASDREALEPLLDEEVDERLVHADEPLVPAEEPRVHADERPLHPDASLLRSDEPLPGEVEPRDESRERPAEPATRPT